MASVIRLAFTVIKKIDSRTALATHVNMVAQCGALRQSKRMPAIAITDVVIEAFPIRKFPQTFGARDRRGLFAWEWLANS